LQPGASETETEKGGGAAKAGSRSVRRKYDKMRNAKVCRLQLQLHGFAVRDATDVAAALASWRKSKRIEMRRRETERERERERESMRAHVKSSHVREHPRAPQLV